MEKSVGIITYVRFYNYGTVLQAYALQKAVNSLLGVKAELIDYRFSEKTKHTFMWYLKVRCKRFFYYFTATRKIFKKLRYKKVFLMKRPRFNDFFEHELVTSENTYLRGEDLRKNPPLYDIYMVGSDQTWSPLLGLYPTLFLDFAPKGSVRVAYAPSIGVTSFSEENKQFYRKMLAPFKRISCREDIGARALSECYDGEVPTVLDPTLLLTSEQWSDIAIKPNISGDYILCYLIGDRPYYRDYIRKLSRSMGCPAYYIPVSWRDVGEGNNLLSDVGPKEFLGLIKHAKCVCTDSFHGAILSLNMNTSFYSFLKVSGGENAQDNSRIVGILKKFGLTDRLRDAHSPVEFKAIDFNCVNERLEELRTASWKFLKEAVDL